MPTQQQIEHVLAIITLLVPFLAALGAMLPESSPLGVFLRRWFSDIKNKNLMAPPPPAPPAKDEASK